MSRKVCSNFEENAFRVSGCENVKYASEAKMGHIYLDKKARNSRSGFILRYYPTSTTSVGSFVGIPVFVLK